MSDLRIHHLAFAGDAVTVTFSDERSITVALRYFPRLLAARPAEREQWQLIGRGLGAHWEVIDEDLSVENFLTAYSRSKAGEYAHAARP